MGVLSINQWWAVMNECFIKLLAKMLAVYFVICFVVLLAVFSEPFSAVILSGVFTIFTGLLCLVGE